MDFFQIDNSYRNTVGLQVEEKVVSVQWHPSWEVAEPLHACIQLGSHTALMILAGTHFANPLSLSFAHKLATSPP